MQPIRPADAPITTFDLEPLPDFGAVLRDSARLEALRALVVDANRCGVVPLLCQQLTRARSVAEFDAALDRLLAV